MTMTHDMYGNHGSSKRSWKLTWPLIVGMIVPTFGSAFPLGYCVGALNSPQKVIRIWIRETLQIQYGLLLSDKQEVTLWAAIVSSFFFGASIMASLGASVANKLGRKRAFLGNHLLALAASLLYVLCKYASSVEMLVLGRLLSGLTSGLGSSLMPIYLSEIAPQPIKGSINVLYSFGLTMGLLISMVSGSHTLLGNNDLWPYHVGLSGITVAISLLLHVFLQESPTYFFFICNDKQAGYETLTALRGDINLAREEGDKMGNNITINKNEKFTWNLYKIIKSPQIKLRFCLAILLSLIYGLSGIGAIYNYANIIFTSSGFTHGQSDIAIICAVASSLLTNVITAVYLLPRWRRRPHLFTSMTGCLLSLISLVISLSYISQYNFLSYVAILSIIGFMSTYQLGLGNIPLVLIAEMLPAGIRSVALSLCVTIMWLTNVLIGLTFPLLQHAIGELSLIAFMVPIVLSGFIFVKYLPETFGIKETEVECNLTSQISEENSAFKS